MPNLKSNYTKDLRTIVSQPNLDQDVMGTRPRSRSRANPLTLIPCVKFFFFFFETSKTSKHNKLIEILFCCF